MQKQDSLSELDGGGTASQSQENIQRRKPYAKQGTLILPQLPNGMNNKHTVLKLESPRTLKACQQLGIDIKTFEFKTLQSFASPGVSEDIQQLRYQHYVNRLQQDFQQIQEQRLEIINHQTGHIRRQTQPMHPNAFNTLPMSPNVRSMAGFADIKARRTPIVRPSEVLRMNKSESDTIDSDDSFIENYNKTIQYLKTNHLSPRVKASDEVLEIDNHDDDGDFKNMGKKLEEQIEKYNQLKRQKQREALEMYNQEIKTIKLVAEIKQKEEKALISLVKMGKQMKEDQDQQMKQSMQQVQHMKDMEEGQKRKKREQREKIEQQLEAIKKKQMQQNEERQKEIAEKKEREIEKRERIKKAVQQQKIQQLEDCELNMKRIMDDLAQKQEQQEIIKREKVQRLQKHLDSKFFSKTSRIGQVTSSTDNLALSQLLDQWYQQQEQKIKNIKQETQEFMDQKNSEKEKQAHHEQLLRRRQELIEKKRRMLSQKSSKNSEFLKKLKEQQQKEMLMKQEWSTLKQKDRMEMRQRNQRIEELKLSQIIQRQQKGEQNLRFLKKQNEIILNAKREVSIQTRVESERIYGSLQQLEVTLFPVGKPADHALHLSPKDKLQVNKIVDSIFDQEVERVDLTIFQEKQKSQKEEQMLSASAVNQQK